MEYTIIRSKRKTVSIEIKHDGTVLVRAPRRVSDKKIDEFVQSKSSWIEKHIKKAKISQLEADSITRISAKKQRELAKTAKTLFPERLDFYASQIGVSYNRLAIRKQKTRWGSCSAKGNINLNLALMLVPEEVRDYVIVHELCHLKEMNHSKRFWSEVEMILPDYKNHRKWLKDNGHAILAQLEVSEEKKYYTYVVRCADNTLYVGYTTDLEKRIEAHNTQKGAKYTSIRGPVQLVYFEEYNTKSEAMSREALLKQLSHKEKEKLTLKK